MRDSSKYEMTEQRGRTKAKQRFGYREQFNFTDLTSPIDFFATGITLSNSGETSVGEIKNYDDPEHPRNFYDYDDYMIDWLKLAKLRAIAKANNSRALLVVFFNDYTIVWDITDIDIDSRREMRKVNKDGQHYGENEILWMETREQTEQKMKLLS